MDAPEPLTRLDRLARFNAAVRAQFAWTMLGVVAVGVAFPMLGTTLRNWELFRIPFTPWRYDFSTLALGAMMLSASVECSLSDFRHLAKRPLVSLVFLVVSYVISPALVVGIGRLCAVAVGPAVGAELEIGLMLSALMPIAMTSSVWTRASGGTLPLLVALITVTTALSLGTVPYYFSTLRLSDSPLIVPTDGISLKLFQDMPLVVFPAAVYMISQHVIAAQVLRLLERLGSTLLGHAVAYEADSLSRFLERTLPEQREPRISMVLLLCRFTGASAQPKRLAGLVRKVRRRLRRGNFVCMLAPNGFGVVLVGSDERGSELVIARLRRWTRELAPDLVLELGTSLRLTPSSPGLARAVIQRGLT